MKAKIVKRTLSLITVLALIFTLAVQGGFYTFFSIVAKMSNSCDKNDKVHKRKYFSDCKISFMSE